MAKIIYADPFIDALADVWSERVLAIIRRALDAVASYPEIGSRDIPESIRLTYGESVRKMVVAPFDIVYDYDRDNDAVNVLGLIHFRQAS